MYGNPTFRFTLSHDVLGSQVISEPQNWQEAKLKLERHEDYYSLIEYFEGSFIFYGSNGQDDGGLEFIKSIESSYGVDAEINIVIEISFDDGETFETVFTGLLDLSDIQESKNNKAEIPIIRNDFWAKFINRRDTPVNLSDDEDLDGNTVNHIDPVDLDLVSQKIQKTTKYEGSISPNQDDYRYDFPTGVDIDFNGANDDYTVFSQIALDKVQSEIIDSFILPIAFDTAEANMFNLIEMKDEGGVIDVSVALDQVLNISGSIAAQSIEADPSVIDSIVIFVTVYAKKNSETPIIIATAGDSHGSIATPTISPVIFLASFNIETSGSIQFNLIPGDTVYVYAKYEIFFNIDVGSNPGSITWTNRFLYISEFASEVTFEIASTFLNTRADGFLIHDAAGSILDKIIGQSDTFYSEFIGSTQTNYRQYLSDGCEWEYSLLQGLQLRGYEINEKQFSMSFNKWWNGANPVLNLGLGYDTVDDSEVIRVEDKEYFFDPTPSLYINYVYEIIREYDKNKIYKKVEVGYSKWESENIAGIDDPQTKHTYATRFEKVGSDIRLHSEFIAASLAIEVTRRQTVEKSKDYKFDNDIFIIAINGDNVSPDRYRPELNENFNYVTNLLNFETRYNLRLTPARNLLRWIKFLNNGLQSYVGSVYKFTFGEGNYDMVSDMVISTPGCDGDYSGDPLSEKQNIDVTGEYVFLPQEFTIEINLSWEDYKTIRENRRKAIAISQTDEDHVAFFIKSIDYEVIKGRATMKLWPVEPFEIGVVDFVPTTQVCEADDCEDAITDSLDQDLVDQFGNCITI
jgi:hypothetical protein